MPPSATVRQEPVGIPLKDGQGTHITLSNDPDISFWEVSLSPPGFDGGDAIQIRNMFNTRYAPQIPPTLITMTEIAGTAQYDPAVLTQIEAQMNRLQTITFTFPDGSTWALYGWLQKFTPNEISGGAQPTAAFTIMPSNADPTTLDEASPVVVSVAGT